MTVISMNETTAQRRAALLAESAPRLLAALSTLANEAWPHLTARQRDMATEAIEYATGAHDPGEYPEAGYEVDAAGTALG